MRTKEEKNNYKREWSRKKRERMTEEEKEKRREYNRQWRKRNPNYSKDYAKV